MRVEWKSEFMPGENDFFILCLDYHWLINVYSYKEYKSLNYEEVNPKYSAKKMLPLHFWVSFIMMDLSFGLSWMLPSGPKISQVLIPLPALTKEPMFPYLRNANKQACVPQFSNEAAKLYIGYYMFTFQLQL